MFKAALIYIIAVVIVPLFFILMTADHPNYHGQFDNDIAIKIITVSGK